MKFIYDHIKGDKVIWTVIFILVILSLATVYTSISPLAHKSNGDTIYYLIRHSWMILSGLSLMYLTHLIPHKYFSRISQIGMYLVIPLLLYTYFKGTSVNAAQRWLTLPVGASFQPSEIAKLFLIIYLARVLSKKQDQIKNLWDSFVPIIWPVILICGIIMPADFSTAAILFVTCLVLMFAGRVNMKYILSLIGITVVMFSLFVLIKVNLSNKGRIHTWKARIENYINGDESVNFQVEQSKIAIARGGLIGKGPGNSIQRNFLPSPYSDFIYAILIEEYGLIAGVILILLYLIILFRGIKIATKIPNSFGALLAIGCSFGIVFQAMINMGVAVNIFPVTGQTLPLISKGGTSIWFTCIALGIVLSVSREVEDENKKVAFA